MTCNAEQGQFNKIDGLMLGVNKNEYSLFVCSQYANITQGELVAYILYYFGVEAGREILRLYPLSQYPTPIAAMVDILSDNIFKCPSKFVCASSTPIVQRKRVTDRALQCLDGGCCVESRSQDLLLFLQPSAVLLAQRVSGRRAFL